MLSIIAAMDRSRVIGRNGSIPWHLPDDLAHFRALTMGHTVLMGRKTFESIGRALPGRRNIVLSRQGFEHPECESASSWEEALSLCAPEENVFVIGGEQLYIRALPDAQRLYVTMVDAFFSGDTFFPAFSPDEFRLVSKRHVPGKLPHTFYEYARADSPHEDHL